jgi:hypothetical protein
MGFGSARESGRGCLPFVGCAMPRQRLPGIAKVRSEPSMDDGGLSAALDRAERAIQRVERALASRQPPAPQADGRDEELRARVREVVSELDELIREAAV